jgi:uncharacterized iron-regulated membrane protein
VAEEVQIQGSTGMAKLRKPWAVAVLSIVTIGIYGAVWWYKINREMADLGKATGRTEELGDNPTKSVIAATLGILIIVPFVMTTINTYKRVQATQRLTGGGEVINGWLVLVMYLVGLSVVGYAYAQSGLNKAWESQAGQVGGPPVAPAVAP